MGLATVDVIIPSFYPDRSFRDLIKRLSKQSYPVSHILIVNTEESGWDDSLVEGIGNAEVFHITRRQFDHAGTRNMGAGFSDADYLIFMTQDAAPTSDTWVSELIAPILRQEATAVSPAEEPPEGTDLYYVISSRVHRHYCGTDTANQLHFGLANGAPDALHRWGALNDVSTAIRRDVFNAMARIGCPILDMQSGNEKLEDMFLKLTSGSGRNGGKI